MKFAVGSESCIRAAGEYSSVIRQRVDPARKIQLQPFEKTKFHSNAQVGERQRE